jgi:type II secretory pathway pseudopilin PulG
MSSQSQDPGKVLTIIGFIMAFLPLQLIGLILSIIGLVQSNKAGRKNGLAIAGIVLNSIGLIFFPILMAITIISYNGITEKANNKSRESTASYVQKYSELYSADNGSYPTTFAELKTYTNDLLGAQTSPMDDLVLASETLKLAPGQLSTIEFYNCNGAGNKIGYWDSTYNSVYYLYTGTAQTADCVLTTE